MMPTTTIPPVRGPMPDEITLSDLEGIWGFGRTRTWELVVKEEVIPYRRDRFRIYVKRADAVAYQHTVRRGRPPERRLWE